MSKPDHRTVFHLPESGGDYGRGALGNVANLLADDTVEVEVAVVANGGGVEHVLSDAPTAGRVHELLENGVEMFACGNTIERSNRDPDDLIDGVAIVSSGMGELTRQQAAGAAYIRP